MLEGASKKVGEEGRKAFEVLEDVCGSVGVFINMRGP